MTTVRQLLKQKGSTVWTVKPDTRICEVLTLLAEKNIGAVLVMEGEKIAGIFSERDFARGSACGSGLTNDSPVRDYMTKMVFYISPDLSMDECMALMTEKRIRHFPVVENNKLVGIISIGDVVREVISIKEIHIRSLENYIMGTDYNR